MTDLSRMSDEELERFVREHETAEKYQKLDFFKPYPKQAEFFAAGAAHDERALIAANQVGKSEAGAAEFARHLVGDYSNGWKGHRFGAPVRAWTAGISGEMVRNIQQTKLCGPYGQPQLLGTGFIPKEAFTGRQTMVRNVTDAFDTIWVKWKDKRGRLDESAFSSCTFKSYTEGRLKFQGEPINLYWEDEEGPMDIHSEARTRLSATHGISFATLSPLLGRTDLINWFTDPTARNRYVVKMGLVDAKHFSAEEIAKRIEDCPIHERPARIYGEPVMGTGRVWLTSEELLKEDPIEKVPEYWRKLWGIDFGIGHYFAAVLIAWDPDTDIVHILHVIKVKDATPLQHAPMLRQIASDVRVAWPHDGTHREKGSGEALAETYRHPMLGMPGLRMLDEHSTWPEGGYSTERAVLEVDNRTKTNRLKCAVQFEEFFSEYRQYHRVIQPDGTSTLVKTNDDVLSALFKALMMLREARSGPLGPDRLRFRGARRKRPASAAPWDPLTGKLLSTI